MVAKGLVVRIVGCPNNVYFSSGKGGGTELLKILIVLSPSRCGSGRMFGFSHTAQQSK